MGGKKTLDFQYQLITKLESLLYMIVSVCTNTGTYTDMPISVHAHTFAYFWLNSELFDLLPHLGPYTNGLPQPHHIA